MGGDDSLPLAVKRHILELERRLSRAEEQSSVLEVMSRRHAEIATRIRHDLEAQVESLEAARARERLLAEERDTAFRRSTEAMGMQLVGSLAAGVAHDFNNLLMIIQMAGSVLREPRSAAEATSAVDDLDAAVFRATQMTRHLLALGRSVHSTAQPAALDLGEIVSATACMFPRLFGPRVHVEVRTHPAAFVLAWRGGVEQVVLNLAVNARDAMPKGGTLSLEVKADEKEVLLVVTDTGEGMDAETQARVFDPFFTTKTTGTGLGLPTVRQLVAEAGGRIELESAVGEGTTFIVRYPRSLVSPVAVTRSAAQPDQESGRLLLVDDDPLVRRATARTLERAGYEVVGVSDGDEALALLELSEFRVMVTDASMARVDGLTLVPAAHARLPDLPIVVLSARYSSPPLDFGPRVVFQSKPADLETLLDAIARASGI